MQAYQAFISQHPYLCGAVLVLFILLTIVELLRSTRKATRINPQQATQMINHDQGVIIDVRSGDAYTRGHIIDAKAFTTATLHQQPKLLDKFKSKPLIIVCDNGNESQKTAAFLRKSGYNAYSLAGGMRTWQDAQLPTVKG